MKRPAFSLVELLVVLGIIAALGTVTLVAVSGARRKARDEVRKTTLNQVARFMAASSCYAPDAGPGEYDLKDIYDELVAKNPQAARLVPRAPLDPMTGRAEASGYRYFYDFQGRCALSANLEDLNAEVTLPDISEPTPGAGTGVLLGPPGPNGSNRWYQVAR